MTSASSRDRILRAAVELFGERGVARTSVADIQSAAGLARGSGALYKHFASKDELVEAVVEGYLATLRGDTENTTTSLPENPRDALVGIAHSTFDAMVHSRHVLRIAFRDLDDRPDLSGRIWDAVLEIVVGAFVAWIQQLPADAQRPEAREAATVLMAALLEHATVHVLTGHDLDRAVPRPYLEVWSSIAAATLHI